MILSEINCGHKNNNLRHHFDHWQLCLLFSSNLPHTAFDIISTILIMCLCMYVYQVLSTNQYSANYVVYYI